jgi:hypothetical protein
MGVTVVVVARYIGHSYFSSLLACCLIAMVMSAMSMPKKMHQWTDQQNEIGQNG